MKAEYSLSWTGNRDSFLSGFLVFGFFFFYVIVVIFLKEFLEVELGAWNLAAFTLAVLWHRAQGLCPTCSAWGSGGDIRKFLVALWAGIFFRVKVLQFRVKPFEGVPWWFARAVPAHWCVVSSCEKQADCWSFLNLRWRGRERGRGWEIGLLFYLFTHLLAAACVCPDQDQTRSLWCTGQGNGPFSIHAMKLVFLLF